MPRKIPIEAESNLRKAREAALLAVETYNRPGASFRSAGFLVLICGQPGTLREGDWIKTLCDEHADADSA